MVPALFIAHGSPMVAIEDSLYARFLDELGRSLPKPRAIAIFSAHWEAPIQQVSEPRQYSTIYDFGGFPPALYQVQYNALGDPELAQRIRQALEVQHIANQGDAQRGLDHGAWTILTRLFPACDIPVVALSINQALAPPQQYEIGKTLSFLRDEDVLVIGSGVTIHNFQYVEFGHKDAPPAPWAEEFSAWLTRRIREWNLHELFLYDTLAPHVRRAVPLRGREHFVPLFYAMGAADSGRRVDVLHHSYQFANLSNTVYQFS